MKVIIKDGAIHEYVSDFDDGWQFSRGDYFKYPVNIGSNNCFIKRFEKKPENISGWKLLEDLKEKHVPNLTRVYDVVKTTENGRIVYYVFFEFVEGRTLYEFVSKKIGLNLEKFTGDLFNALQNLHVRNYWFADFCEKNIFCSKSGSFLLIDLDSTQQVSDVPDNEMWGSKEYWAFVFKFCKDILHYKEFKPSQFNGASFNYLHAIFLILRLKIFYNDDEMEYDSTELKNQLPYYLNDASSSFKKIFDKVFQNEKYPLEARDIIEMKNLVMEKILNLPGSVVKIEDDKILPATGPEKPVINAFTVSNVEKKGNEFTIESGKPFILKWNVENAQKVGLDKDDQPYRQFTGDENNIELKEESGGKEKVIKYTLVVSGGDDSLESVEKTSLIVKIIDPAEKIIKRKPPVIKPAVVKPAISEFTINNYFEKNQDYYVVESGKPFILAWKVNNAKEIEIQKDGQHLKTVNSVESMELTENVDVGKEKKINYTLSALSAGTSEASSRSLNIIVKRLNRLTPVIKQFKSSKYILRNGGAFILSWNVQNAPDIELYKNEVLYKTYSGGENNIELKENYEGVKKEIKYTLQASNGFEKAVSQPVIISVKPPFTLKMVLVAAAALVLLIALFFIISSLAHNRKKDKIVFFPPGPDTIKTGDTITIPGKYLPENDNNIEIKFNDIKGENVLLTKDSIRVKVPELRDKPEYVDIVANIKSHEYRIAQHLAYTENIIPVPPIPSNSQSTQSNIQPTNNVLQQQDSVHHKKTEVVAGPPKVNPFSKSTVTEGETITIAGANLPAGGVVVNFNNVQATIVKQKSKSLTVQVPALPDGTRSVDIIVHIKGQVQYAGNNISYQPKNVKAAAVVSKPRESAISQDTRFLDIEGENLDKGDVKVMFDQNQASIITRNPKDLRVQVPALRQGIKKVTISVLVNGQPQKTFDIEVR